MQSFQKNKQVYPRKKAKTFILNKQQKYVLIQDASRFKIIKRISDSKLFFTYCYQTLNCNYKYKQYKKNRYIMNIQQHIHYDQKCFLLYQYTPYNLLYHLESGQFSTKQAISFGRQISSALISFINCQQKMLNFSPFTIFFKYKNDQIQFKINLLSADQDSIIEYKIYHPPQTKLNRAKDSFITAPTLSLAAYNKTKIQKVYVFTLGIILFEMIFNKNLFNKQSQLQSLKQLSLFEYCIKKQKVQEKDIQSNKKIFKVLQKMIRYDQNKRITLNQFIQHQPFKISFNFQTIIQLNLKDAKYQNPTNQLKYLIFFDISNLVFQKKKYFRNQAQIKFLIHQLYKIFIVHSRDYYPKASLSFRKKFLKSLHQIQQWKNKTYVNFQDDMRKYLDEIGLKNMWVYQNPMNIGRDVSILRQNKKAISQACLEIHKHCHRTSLALLIARTYYKDVFQIPQLNQIYRAGFLISWLRISQIARIQQMSIKIQRQFFQTQILNKK